MKNFHLRSSCILILLLSIPLFMGCNEKPSDFPDLYPCTITILNHGKPEEGVSIMFQNDDMSVTPTTVSSGQTNSSGQAAIVTLRPTYQGKGMPKGTYTVTIMKNDIVEGTKSKEEIRKMTSRELDEHGKLMDQNAKTAQVIVPMHLRNSETSPLKMVVEGSTKIEFDLKDYPQPDKKK